METKNITKNIKKKTMVDKSLLTEPKNPKKPPLPETPPKKPGQELLTD